MTYIYQAYWLTVGKKTLRFSGSVIYNEFATSLCFLSSVPELTRTRGSWSERIKVDVSACELMTAHESDDERVLETIGNLSKHDGNG